MRDQRALLGIIGGMGSAASARMIQRLITLTDAASDADHLEFVLHNNSHVPDRTVAIEGRGPSPLPELQRSLDLLTAAGAGVIAVPCMTSHHFLCELQPPVGVTILDGIRETAAACRRLHPQVRRVGLLATSGSVNAGLYQRAFAELGLEILCPDASGQERVMTAIYGEHGIKSGFTDQRPRGLLLDVSAELIAAGAQAMIAGCTEVPLVMADGDLEVPLLDTIDILCLAVLRECGTVVP